MTDSDLEMLAAASAEHGEDPLADPPPAALDYLSSLDLSNQDLELLLGDSPGLSFADVKKNGAALSYRLRQRLSQIICADEELKQSARVAINAGVDALWVALIGALGLAPGTIAAAALKPMAGSLVVSGVQRLCCAPGDPSDAQ